MKISVGMNIKVTYPLTKRIVTGTVWQLFNDGTFIIKLFNSSNIRHINPDTLIIEAL